METEGLGSFSSRLVSPVRFDILLVCAEERGRIKRLVIEPTGGPVSECFCSCSEFSQTFRNAAITLRKLGKKAFYFFYKETLRKFSLFS